MPPDREKIEESGFIQTIRNSVDSLYLIEKVHGINKIVFITPKYCECRLLRTGWL